MRPVKLEGADRRLLELMKGSTVEYVSERVHRPHLDGVDSPSLDRPTSLGETVGIGPKRPSHKI